VETLGSGIPQLGKRRTKSQIGLYSFFFLLQALERHKSQRNKYKVDSYILIPPYTHIQHIFTITLRPFAIEIMRLSYSAFVGLCLTIGVVDARFAGVPQITNPSVTAFATKEWKNHHRILNVLRGGSTGRFCPCII
jgi:hypothetical protein